MRVVTNASLCLLVVGLGIVAFCTSDARLPVSESREADGARSTAADNRPIADHPTRHLAATSPEDRPGPPHLLILEDDRSTRLPGQTLILSSDAWSAQIQTDDSGEALVPRDAPRFARVSVPVPLLLTQPVSFEAVPGGTTRVVVQAAIDTIKGVVHDTQGQPVEGVAVCGSKLAVVTAANGSFCMPRYRESPGDGESLYCSKVGYQPLQTTKTAWGSHGVILTIAPLATVDLSVRRAADGTLVRRFFAQRGHSVGDRVQWSEKVHNNGHDSIRLTDLVDGKNTLRVWPGTTTDWAAASIDVEVFAGTRDLWARVDVPSSRHLDVIVEDERGQPIGDAFVVVEEWLGIDTPSAEIVSDASRHNWREMNSSLTGHDGRSTLSLSSDGGYIRITKTGYGSTRTHTVRSEAELTVTLHPLLGGTVVGAASVARILRACGWSDISIELISTATHSVVATVWHESNDTAEVPPGAYAVIATGMMQSDRSTRRCSVGLGRFSTDRPGWTLNVGAMRNEWQFGVVIAQVVCDGVPAANKTVRLKRAAPPDGGPTSVTPVFVTDEFGVARFLASTGQYIVLMPADPQRTGTLTVPDRGSEVSGALVVLR